LTLATLTGNLLQRIIVHSLESSIASCRQRARCGFEHPWALETRVAGALALPLPGDFSILKQAGWDG